MSYEDDLLNDHTALERSKRRRETRSVLFDERIEAALRLDIAGDQEQKQKMIDSRKATLGQIQDQQRKIESKLDLLHRLLTLKRVTYHE